MSIMPSMCVAFALALTIAAGNAPVSADENDVYVITAPERTLEQINQKWVSTSLK